YLSGTDHATGLRDLDAQDRLGQRRHHLVADHDRDGDLDATAAWAGAAPARQHSSARPGRQGRHPRPPHAGPVGPAAVPIAGWRELPLVSHDTAGWRASRDGRWTAFFGRGSDL